MVEETCIVLKNIYIIINRLLAEKKIELKGLADEGSDENEKHIIGK